MNNCCNATEIKAILEKICHMQHTLVKEELEEHFCDRDFFSGDECEIKCNTRPIQLFTDDDKAWKCPFEGNEDGCEPNSSCVFRVEKVKDGTVTVRALIVENEGQENCGQGHKAKFKSTNSFKTINIGCICAIRCLKDTFVDLCIR